SVKGCDASFSEPSGPSLPAMEISALYQRLNFFATSSSGSFLNTRRPCLHEVIFSREGRSLRYCFLSRSKITRSPGNSVKGGESVPVYWKVSFPDSSTTLVWVSSSYAETLNFVPVTRTTACSVCT